jgi:hypothetical protein
MFGYVYLVISDVPGHCYIGQRHGSFDPFYMGSGLVITRAIRKHGKHKFSVHMLESHDDQSSLDQAEIDHIAIARGFGVPVCNILPGGRGMGCGYKRPPEVCLAISMARRGRASKMSPEAMAASRAKFSATMRGRKRPPEAIAKMIASNRGRVATPEARANMSAARKGRKFSPLTEEHKRKLSESNKLAKRPK